MSHESNIKLFGGHNIHGYFNTSEGRNFLRKLYPSYLAREPHGDWKIATIIADDRPNDDKEIDRTRSALRRWSAGQSELWGKDAAKSLRLMERLEHQMMLVPEISAILDDQAASIQKIDVGNALSLLFYGKNISEKYSKYVDFLSEFEGLYECTEGAWDTKKHGRKFYCYYKKPKGLHFLIAHEFTLDHQDNNRPLIKNRNSGYVFPVKSVGSSMEFHRFMISHTDPKHRKVEMLTEKGRNGDIINYLRYRHQVYLTDEPISDAYERVMMKCWPMQNLFVEKMIEKSLWDILL